jgi:CheY-like chemotaxis protein
VKKILIVEDEEIIRDLLKGRLAKEGYEVVAAEDGVEGLEKLSKDKPDLVILDVIMPRMGGFEVMEKMNEDPELKKIPIVVVSNSGQPVELNKAKELGAKDWLIKTEFDPREVVDKVKKQLGD